MIVFDLQCLDGGEQFEAWFGSNADFDEQAGQGLVRCPICQSSKVTKAPMAPQVPRKESSESAAGKALARLARAQAELLRNSEWVGDRFAETARAMHLGEIAESAVHGEATPDEAQSLIEDGVPIATLPLPIVPPTQVN